MGTITQQHTRDAVCQAHGAQCPADHADELVREFDGLVRWFTARRQAVAGRPRMSASLL